MNFPLGQVIQEEINAKQFDWKQKLNEFDSTQFTGYIVLTLEGVNGIEEGLLIFRKGKSVASYYEFMKFGLPVFGEKAVPIFFNGLNADYCNAEIHSLSVQQAELILAFNDEIKFKNEKSKQELNKLFSSGFSSKYAKDTLSEVLKSMETKSEVFKRIGLTNLTK